MDNLNHIKIMSVLDTIKAELKTMDFRLKDIEKAITRLNNELNKTERR